jgi:hypothetical protein
MESRRTSADLVALFGPPAVGKTAVGRELAKLTGFMLYHGHMTMDVISEFFAFGTLSFMRLHRLVQAVLPIVRCRRVLAGQPVTV